jgi:UDP-glucose 4-epimerase
MHVLVTGGAGYIGSHVVRALRAAGHTAVVVDDLSTGHRESVEGREGVSLVVGDLADPALLDAVFGAEQVSAVVHIAGKALAPESVRDPWPYYRVNTLAGLTLLEAMRRHAVQRLVFSSTCAVYGTPPEVPVTEDTPKVPISPYGHSKWAFETALQAYRAYGLLPLALRYFNVAGASSDGSLGEVHDPETHLIPNLLRAAAEGQPFQLYGTDYPTRDGTCERDYVHVEDLARAHVMALGLEQDPAGFGGALNLGTGRGVTVREMLSAVEQVTGRAIQVDEAPRRPGDPPALVADASLAERVLGFRAEHDLASMVRSAHAFHTTRGS